MSKETIKAEDTCLIHHNDVTIATPTPTPSLVPPQRLEIPALTGFAPATPSPPSCDDKAELALGSNSNNDYKGSSTTDSEDDKFPEGGARAWSVTAGSFCALFAIFGVINTTAIFQEYFSSHQLSGYSPGQIGWIFSLSLFLTFFCGNPIGLFFDAKGLRGLVLAGSVLLIVSMMLLGLCTSMCPSIRERCIVFLLLTSRQSIGTSSWYTVS